VSEWVSDWVSHWVSELLIWDCKFGYTSQYIFKSILTLRCIGLHNAHWLIRIRPLVITDMTKLTRYHLLQLEGSSRALPFCQSLTTWQVCDVRWDAEMLCGVVWQLRGKCLGMPQSRVAACRINLRPTGYASFQSEQTTPLWKMLFAVPLWQILRQRDSQEPRSSDICTISKRFSRIRLYLEANRLSTSWLARPIWSSDICHRMIDFDRRVPWGKTRW